MPAFLPFLPALLALGSGIAAGAGMRARRKIRQGKRRGLLTSPPTRTPRNPNGEPEKFPIQTVMGGFSFGENLIATPSGYIPKGTKPCKKCGGK
jgi:hypothetical protein